MHVCVCVCVCVCVSLFLSLSLSRSVGLLTKNMNLQIFFVRYKVKMWIRFEWTPFNICFSEKRIAGCVRAPACLRACLRESASGITYICTPAVRVTTVPHERFS